MVTVRTGSGHLVTHRIVRLAAIGPVAYVETRGDANPTPDPVISPVANVEGRMLFAIPHLGALSMAMQRPAGWIALISLLLFLAVAAELLRHPTLDPRRRATPSGPTTQRGQA